VGQPTKRPADIPKTPKKFFLESLIDLFLESKKIFRLIFRPTKADKVVAIIKLRGIIRIEKCSVNFIINIGTYPIVLQQIMSCQFG
jgi:hypothetical protein